MDTSHMLLHQLTQEVIDSIGKKDWISAKSKIKIAKDYITELTDYATKDNSLVSLKKYTLLLDTLETKIP